MRPTEYQHSIPPASASRKPPLLALVAISTLSPFAINSIVPSMPAVAATFGAEYGRVQLILSLFLASVAISQVFIGPLSDRFGRRPVLLIGFTAFVVVSLLSPFAPNIDTLIGMRVLQGAAGCVGIVLGRAIVRDLYDRRQAASMLGYVTMGLAVAPMLAPIIGGALQEMFDWEAIFWFTGLMGIGCLAVAWVYVPETHHELAPRLSFTSVFSDYWKLVRDWDFVLFTASSGLTTGVFFTFLGGAPYVSEHFLGLKPGVYGVWFGAAPVGYIIGNYLSGRFTERFGVARMILGGSLLSLLSTLLLPLLFSVGLAGAPELFLPMVLVGLANGLTLPSAISGAVSVRPDIAGAAAGLSGAAQIGLGAVFSTVGGAVLTGAGAPMPMFILMTIAAALALLAAVAIYPRNRPRPTTG